MAISSLLRDLSIRNKLVIAFAALVVLFVLLGGTAIQRFGAMESRAHALATDDAMAIGYLANIRLTVLNYRATLLRALVLRDSSADAKSRLDAAMRKLEEQYDQSVAVYAPTVNTDEERQLYQGFQAKWTEFRQGTVPMRALIVSGKLDEAIALIRALTPLGDEVEAILRKDADYNQRMATALADEVTQANQTGFWVVIAVVLASVLIAALAGWLLVRSIADPVRRMTEAMRRLADHDMTAEFADGGRKDEIGAMADAIHVFKDSMMKADTMEAAQAGGRAAHEQRGIHREALVRDFEAKAAGLVRLLTGASGQMEATARAMTETAGRTRDLTQGLAGSADAASAGAQTVASAAQELSASIGEISRQVDQSSRITGQAVAAAERTDAIVRALADGAQKIGDVVGLITSIAGQTNLLALNATIEAARAGEAGKGFAVVASEVKNLANQTGKATEEIAAQIGQIQNSTKEAVAAIQDITRTIEQVSTIATSIAAAMEEQGSATAEIARNVQQTAANTDAVRDNIAGVSQAATETGSAADQVLGAAGQLSRQADDLSREVTGFVAGVRAA